MLNTRNGALLIKSGLLQTTCQCCSGACCVGSLCSQRSGQQCEAGFFIGSRPVTGVFVGSVPCNPNPCCPDCVPPSFFAPDGKCCRSVYVEDGNGACCPNDCCGGLQAPGTPIADDGKNGACCPDDKPFCCQSGVDGDTGGTKACSSSPRTPCPGLIHRLSPCGVSGFTLAGREMTFSCESGQFTARAIVGGQRLIFSGSVIHETEVLDVTIDYGSGDIPFAGQLIFCKPPGVTSITVKIGAIREFTGPCVNADPAGQIVGPECDCYQTGVPADDPVSSSAWSVLFECLDGCQCAENPLP